MSASMSAFANQADVDFSAPRLLSVLTYWNA